MVFRLIEKLEEIYFVGYAMHLRVISEEGLVLWPKPPGVVDRLIAIRQIRAHALSEGIRWGAPYSFFLAPGIISWIIPLVRDREIVGGLIGGEVLAEGESKDRLEGINHLVGAGAGRQAASEYVFALPAWKQSRIHEAANTLYSEFYRLSNWNPLLLVENLEKASQQREIAEEIHRRKVANETSYPLEEERLLLSLIRAGDRRGARKVLNQLVGAMFQRSGNPTVVRASMIELMGYLVRTAIEDSAFLSSLIEKNQQWTAMIIDTRELEDLALTMRKVLDEFMERIYLFGLGARNRSVRKALEYIEGRFTEQVLLGEVASHVGVSSSRLCHLLKEHTGRSLIQHIHGLRLREAQRLLEETEMSCADVAYEVGFADQSYFTKQFRLHTGLTPTRYRHLHRQV